MTDRWQLAVVQCAFKKKNKKKTPVSIALMWESNTIFILMFCLCLCQHSCWTVFLSSYSFSPLATFPKCDTLQVTLSQVSANNCCPKGSNVAAWISHCALQGCTNKERRRMWKRLTFLKTCLSCLADFYSWHESNAERIYPNQSRELK